MEDTIMLFPSKASECWIARFQGPHSEEVKGLFGTIDIPTPFTLAAAKEKVISGVSARNPGVRVYLAEGL